ncbi:hypothetical protein ACQXW1_03165 [Lactiplantibacillus pentosus]|uniref:beta-lactamase family protein n=1 Tax=Lactiplantibacillus pentosus TaxID=1589 RepID=UPI0015995818|nr:beta-lactamase family protein [Lactiplantibacillus pentosus]MCT3291758.1 hypothetical protein [Lactiplantibacillus pentosus]BBM20599.1 beta-lactamase class C family protein [Lactiplantibacillus plantarum]
MQKKKIFTFFLSLVIVALTVGLFVSVQHVKDKGIAKQQDELKRTDLAMSLNSRTNLGYNDMPEKNKIKITRVYDAMQKDNFFGMYIGVKNNQMLFSGSNGYSNASTGKKFNMASMFDGGGYQGYLNNAMIIRFIDQGKLKESTKLSEYIPALKRAGDVSVRQLLVDGSNLFISKELSKSGNTTTTLSNSAFKKVSSDGLVSADGFIKARLIAGVMHSSYRAAFKKIITNHFDLMNTEIQNTSTKRQATDVIGYKYHRKNGLPDQSQQVKASVVLQGVNQLKISVPDILITYKEISNNKYFSKKYNDLWKKSLQRSSLALDETKKGSTIKLAGNKQQIVIQADFQSKTIIAVAENFPNTKLTTSSLMEKLSHALNK